MPDERSGDGGQERKPGSKQEQGRRERRQGESDGTGLRQENERLQRRNERLRRENDRLKRKIDHLEKQLAAARRAGFRQAAPFAKDRLQGRGGRSGQRPPGPPTGAERAVRGRRKTTNTTRRRHRPRARTAAARSRTPGRRLCTRKTFRWCVPGARLRQRRRPLFAVSAVRCSTASAQLGPEVSRWSCGCTRIWASRWPRSPIRRGPVRTDCHSGRLGAGAASRGPRRRAGLHGAVRARPSRSPLDDAERFAARLDTEFAACSPFSGARPLTPPTGAPNRPSDPAVVTRKVGRGDRTRHGADTQQVLASVVRTAYQRDLDLAPLIATMLRATTNPTVPDEFQRPLAAPHVVADTRSQRPLRYVHHVDGGQRILPEDGTGEKSRGVT